MCPSFFSSTVEPTPRTVRHLTGLHAADKISKELFAGSIKKGNRKSEILLRDVEVRATVSVLVEAPAVVLKQRNSSKLS